MTYANRVKFNQEWCDGKQIWSKPKKWVPGTLLKLFLFFSSNTGQALNVNKPPSEESKKVY